MTVEFENCDKTNRFKDSEPAKYRELLQDLAALEDCRAKKKELRDWESELVHKIQQALPHKKMMIIGFGLVERTFSRNRSWDHEEMFKVLTARALDHRHKKVDEETGEVLWYEPEHQAVMRVIQECAGVGYWKLTPLRETYGVDPDEYYATTSTKVGVKITNR